jgi:hypothetical protein
MDDLLKLAVSFLFFLIKAEFFIFIIMLSENLIIENFLPKFFIMLILRHVQNLEFIKVCSFFKIFAREKSLKEVFKQIVPNILKDKE